MLVATPSWTNETFTVAFLLHPFPLITTVAPGSPDEGETAHVGAFALRNEAEAASVVQVARISTAAAPAASRRYRR
jgi:hypothetical protein